MCSSRCWRLFSVKKSSLLHSHTRIHTRISVLSVCVFSSEWNWSVFQPFELCIFYYGFMILMWEGCNGLAIWSRFPSQLSSSPHSLPPLVTRFVAGVTCFCAFRSHSPSHSVAHLVFFYFIFLSHPYTSGSNPGCFITAPSWTVFFFITDSHSSLSSLFLVITCLSYLSFFFYMWVWRHLRYSSSLESSLQTCKFVVLFRSFSSVHRQRNLASLSLACGVSASVASSVVGVPFDRSHN